MGVCGGKAMTARTCPATPARCRQLEALGQPHLWTSGAFLGMGTGQGPDKIWTWQGRTEGNWELPCCETGADGPGGWHGVLGCGQHGGDPHNLGRDMVYQGHDSTGYGLNNENAHPKYNSRK